MTLTTLITLNAVLAAAIAYGLHHLLAHGIRSDRINHPVHASEVVEPSLQEDERLAA